MRAALIFKVLFVAPFVQVVLASNSASLTLLTGPPSTMSPGASATVAFSATNTGTTAWTPASTALETGRYTLSVRLLKLDAPNPYAAQIQPFTELYLPQTVSPGQTVTVQGTFVAPQTPGTYGFYGHMNDIRVESFCSGSAPSELQAQYNACPHTTFNVGTTNPVNSANLTLLTGPPSTMAPGASATVAFSATNTGTTTWTPASTALETGRYTLSVRLLKLDALNPYAAQIQPFTELYLPQTVSPGQTVTVQGTFVAPQTPGTYGFYGHMNDIRVESFCSGSAPSELQAQFNACPHTTFNVASTNPVNSANLTLLTGPPSTMAPGASTTVAFSATNTGTSTWTPASTALETGRYTLSVRLLKLDASNPYAAQIQPFTELYLPQTVSPGQTVTVQGTFVAPQTPGTYGFYGHMNDIRVESFCSGSAPSELQAQFNACPHTTFNVAPTNPVNSANLTLLTGPPSTMAPGASATVAFSATNTGTTTWTPASTALETGRYTLSVRLLKLDALNPYAAQIQPFTELYLPQTVSPGQTVTVQGTFVAPQTPGTYGFYGHMNDIRVESFCSGSAPSELQAQFNACPHTTFNVGTTNPVNSANLTLLTGPPSTMAPGASTTVTFSATNTGTTTWTPASTALETGRYTLSVRLLKLDALNPYAAQIQPFTELYLPQTVSPGQTVTVQGTFVAPQTPGTYGFYGHMNDIRVESFCSGSAPSELQAQFNACPHTTFNVAPITTCNYFVEPLTANVNGAGGDVLVMVSTAPTCSWTSTSNAGWISLSVSTSISGAGAVQLRVSPNDSASPRTGTAVVAGQTVTVNQSGRTARGPQITPGGIVNAASWTYPPGGIALGSYVVIQGIQFGPASALTATDYPLPTTLGAIAVEIAQGTTTTRAFLKFVSATQINAIIPSSLQPGDASIAVSYNGTSGEPLNIRLADAGFGVFYTNDGGTPFGIVQNIVSATNYPLNGKITPATPGQTIVIWGTGLGAIKTPDNVAPPVGDLTSAVTITAGGVPALRTYSGRAPLFAGVDVIYATLPSNVPLGCSVPLLVTVNGAPGNSVNIAISADGGPCR